MKVVHIVDWEKVLKIEVPGEVYSAIVRKINPDTDREKNFPVKDDIKNLIRDGECDYRWQGGSEDGMEQTVEWICHDEDGDTRILGNFVRERKNGKRVTKIAEFDIFTSDGKPSARSERIKGGLVDRFSGVIKETIEGMKKKAKKAECRIIDDAAFCYENPEVFKLIDKLSSDVGISKTDAGLLVGKYKWMLSSERHWVVFGHKLSVKQRQMMSQDDIKNAFNIIHKSGVKIE